MLVSFLYLYSETMQLGLRTIFVINPYPTLTECGRSGNISKIDNITLFFKFLNSTLFASVFDSTSDISLLFKGCSGSGKTESLKLAIHYLLWADLVHDFTNGLQSVRNNLGNEVVKTLSSTSILTTVNTKKGSSNLQANRIGSYSLNSMYPHENKNGRIFVRREIGRAHV